jgi:hypothetical protein
MPTISPARSISAPPELPGLIGASVWMKSYYGQWPGKKALFAGLESAAIAHNELAASARFVAFDVPERDFPGNRSLLCWKFLCRPKRKICAPGEARFRRRPRRSPLLSKATARITVSKRVWGEVYCVEESSPV